MANTKTTTVLERLLDDDYIHEQITVAGTGLRDAYRRVRHLPPEKAIRDKTVYDRVRQAASGLSEATRRALGKPEPKPRRNRGLLVVVALATGGVVAWSAKNSRRKGQTSGGPDAVSTPFPPTSVAGADGER